MTHWLFERPQRPRTRTLPLTALQRLHFLPPAGLTPMPPLLKCQHLQRSLLPDWLICRHAGDKNRQLTRYSDTRWHEDSVRNRWFSMMAGPSVRVNEWFSAYAMAGVAYSRVSTFSGDYLRVTDNKGKTHDVLTGSDDGRHSNTSLAWGAGVQFNPAESVAIDIAYEGSGSGDWRTDGFIVGVGHKF